MSISAVTLKPSDFATDRVYAFPDYVSNGHWLVHRALVANWPMFATVDAIGAYVPKAYAATKIDATNEGADKILSAIPADPPVWEVQPWIHVKSTRRRPIESYVLICNHVVTYVDRVYLDRFGVRPGDTLHGQADGKGALASADREWLVMPTQIDGAIEELIKAVTPRSVRVEE